MGVGLGRNSPVVLTLGKDNYEALIDRHGQWIRWRSASKCSCVTLPSMQPDIHCKICGGRGYTYSFQKTQLRFSTVMLNDISKGILELNDEFIPFSLKKVYDFEGKEYKNAEKIDSYVILNEAKLPKKGTYFNVILEKNNIKILESAEVEKLNSGYYRIPGLRNSKPNIDGIYYTTPSDIISITSIKDSAGISYTPQEFRLDTFRILPTVTEQEDPETGEIIEVEVPITEPVFVENVSYLPPFIFALLNQNLSKTDAQAVEDYSGDAICSFPYSCDLSSDDVLTVLTGSYTKKEVNPRSNYETDTLDVYFVYDIISCTGIINGEIVEYKEGVDFIIVGTNKIKWLDTDICPEVGDAYSITYHALPTYKVVKEIPQIRTSENQRFPKKAVVKLLSTYSENVGVNVQAIGRNGKEGSL